MNRLHKILKHIKNTSASLIDMEDEKSGLRYYLKLLIKMA